MAFIYCDDCGWEQDDFWSKDKDGYSPFRPDLIADLRSAVFEDKVYVGECTLVELGLPVRKDAKGYYAVAQEYVAIKLIHKAKCIMNMQVRTNEEWNYVKDGFVCPECGSTHIGVD